MSNENPYALGLWNRVSQQYPYVTNQGIWGDKAHQARKSDHNTGDAIDLGIPDVQRGSALADEILKNAQGNGVKYLIFNNQIWNPQQGWHAYNGADPHTGHVHVSFLRDGNAPAMTLPPEAAGPAPSVAQQAPITPLTLNDTDISGLMAPMQIAQTKVTVPQMPKSQRIASQIPNQSLKIAQSLPDLLSVLNPEGV